MTTIENVEERLTNFLGGTFNQDMGSPQSALQEFIDRVSKDWLQVIVESATEFLNSDKSDEEKEDFIESETEIYFPAIGMTPIEWLEDVVKQLKTAVKLNTN